MTSTAVIPFHGATIRAAEQQGVIYIAVNPICEHLGIDLKTQLRKLERDAKFNHRHMTMVAADGKLRNMVCLPQDELLGWLYTINSRKVKAASRDLLLAYQRETTRAIHDHWAKLRDVRPHVVTPPTPPTPSRPARSETDPIVLLLENAARERREFMALEQRVTAVEENMRDTPITYAQRKVIYDGVRSWAVHLGGTPKDYAYAWQKFKEYMGVAAYPDIPERHYTRALDWIRAKLSDHTEPQSLQMN